MSRTEKPALTFTKTAARRIALNAQGFGNARPKQVTARHISQIVSRLGFFQIDSVNILQRAHYLPLFSRVGPYEIAKLHAAAEKHPRKLFEYWAHEAALVDVSLFPALRFRMENPDGMWGSMRRIAEEKPVLVERVYQEVKERGPLTARDIAQDLKSKNKNWGWNWTAEKAALEYLFYVGRISTAQRNSAFERLYDITERIIPEQFYNAPALDSSSAHRELIRHAARAHGIATERSLRDYFRMKPQPVKTAVRELVESGELLPAKIANSRFDYYVPKNQIEAKPILGQALLSPFDPVVFDRSRAEDLFDFRYRIEIYVPAEKRIHGYYVLPFLLNEKFVARVDLKADRKSSQLQVLGAFAEADAPPETAERLASSLGDMASWLGLKAIKVGQRGDLVRQLRGIASNI